MTKNWKIALGIGIPVVLGGVGILALMRYRKKNPKVELAGHNPTNKVVQLKVNGKPVNFDYSDPNMGTALGDHPITLELASGNDSDKMGTAYGVYVKDSKGVVIQTIRW